MKKVKAIALAVLALGSLLSMTGCDFDTKVVILTSNSNSTNSVDLEK